MGTRQGKGTLGQGWAKTWDKAGTRLGTGLEARLGPWPWGSKFGLEKNFCSSVWKPILSDHAESEGSTAKMKELGHFVSAGTLSRFLTLRSWDLGHGKLAKTWASGPTGTKRQDSWPGLGDQCWTRRSGQCPS